MKHHRIVIAAISVALALPALGQPAGNTAVPLPSATPEQWAAPSTFIYPSQSYWSDPKAIEGFVGSYRFMESVEPPELTMEEGVVFREVVAFMELDQKVEAMQMLLNHIIAFPAASPAFPFNIANLYVDQGKLEEALPYYRQAISGFDNFLRAHKLLGIVLIQLGRFEEAIPHLVKTTNLGITDGITYGLLGLAYYSTGQLLAAESSFRNAVIFAPDEEDWRVHLATTLMEERKYPDAIALLDQLIEADPEGEDLWMYQANAYLATDEVNKAASNFEIVRRMGTASVDSLLLLGDIYLNQNLKSMALEAFLEAIAIGGEASATVPRLVSAARILVGRNSLAEGERLLEVIDSTFKDVLTPDDELLVLKLRSQIAISNGDSEEAAEILQLVVDSDPFDGEALMLLGAHFRGTDEVAKAEIFFERAGKVQEFRVYARKAHAQMLIRVERYSDALPLLEEAYQAEPDDALQRFIQQVRAIIQRSAAF